MPGETRGEKEGELPGVIFLLAKKRAARCFGTDPSPLQALYIMPSVTLFKIFLAYTRCYLMHGCHVTTFENYIKWLFTPIIPSTVSDLL